MNEPDQNLLLFPYIAHKEPVSWTEAARVCCLSQRVLARRCSIWALRKHSGVRLDARAVFVVPQGGGLDMLFGMHTLAIFVGNLCRSLCKRWWVSGPMHAFWSGGKQSISYVCCNVQ